MTKDGWRPCIVTVIDIDGTKKLAPSGEATFNMLKMRDFSVNMINDRLEAYSYGYVWNDSVLLVSHQVKNGADRRKLLFETSEFKWLLESHCDIKTYAISVKGLAFPDDPTACARHDGSSAHPRVTVLRSSSWAMANCFKIESELKAHKADWYIDSRITKDTDLRKPMITESIKLLPKNVARTIHMYKGWFH